MKGSPTHLAAPPSGLVFDARNATTPKPLKSMDPTTVRTKSFLLPALPVVGYNYRALAMLDPHAEKAMNLEPAFTQQRMLPAGKRRSSIVTGAIITICAVLVAVAWDIWDGRNESQIPRILSRSSQLVKSVALEGARFENVENWLHILVISGEASTALESARIIKNISYRSRALVSISRSLARAGKIDEALQVADEALESIRKIDETDLLGSRMMFGIIEVMAKAGKTAEALASARKIGYPDFRSRAMFSIVEALGEAGRTDEALQIANEALALTRKIDDADLRSRAMVRIVLTLEKIGRTDEALQVVQEALASAREAESSTYRFQAMANVVEALTKIGRTSEALATARVIDDAYSRSMLMAGIAGDLAKVNQKNEALQVANEGLASVRKIEDASPRAWATASIVEALGMAGKRDQALQVAGEAFESAGRIEEVYARSVHQVRIVEALVKAGNTDEALASARKIEDADLFCKVMVNSAGALEKLGKRSEAIEISNEALISVPKIGNAVSRFRALASIAEALARAGKTDEALVTARNLEDAAFRSRAMVLVADAVSGNPDAGKAKSILDEAQRVAQQITKDSEKSTRLAAVAIGAAKIHQYRWAREIADLCLLPSHKLSAYTAIFRDYLIERDPALEKVLDDR
jgi:tetratricopeptide (TPR) repeat protein